MGLADRSSSLLGCRHTLHAPHDVCIGAICFGACLPFKHLLPLGVILSVPGCLVCNPGLRPHWSPIHQADAPNSYQAALAWASMYGSVPLTLRRHAGSASLAAEGALDIVSSLLSVVHLPELPDADMAAIVGSRVPQLQALQGPGLAMLRICQLMASSCSPSARQAAQ